MWLSRTALVLAACLALLPGAAAALCLPPAYGGGRRLHDPGAIRVFWLGPLLRQHEVCWRDAPPGGERRVFLVGNSAVFGFPHPADAAVAAVLNRRFAGGPPAHFFNLGFGYTYQLKEVLILREAVRYRPDLVIYGLSLDDLDTVLPIAFPPVMRFLNSNQPAIAALAAQEPPGLAEPLAFYADHQPRSTLPPPVWSLRQAGLLARDTARAQARALVPRLGAEPAPTPGVSVQPVGDYDCAEVAATFERRYRDWQKWNLMAYLEWLRGESGVPVLVVNWPVAYEPRGACYNSRYTAEALAAYGRWLERETRSRGIPYVDLHDLLPASEFVDTLHPTVAGQRRIAEALEDVVTGLLSETAPGGEGDRVTSRAGRAQGSPRGSPGGGS